MVSSVVARITHTQCFFDDAKYRIRRTLHTLPRDDGCVPACAYVCAYLHYTSIKKIQKKNTLFPCVNSTENTSAIIDRTNTYIEFPVHPIYYVLYAVYVYLHVFRRRFACKDDARRAHDVNLLQRISRACHRRTVTATKDRRFLYVHDVFVTPQSRFLGEPNGERRREAAV